MLMLQLESSGHQSSGEVKSRAALPQDPCAKPQHSTTGFVSLSVPLELISCHALGGDKTTFGSLVRPTNCTLLLRFGLGQSLHLHKHLLLVPSSLCKPVPAAAAQRSEPFPTQVAIN